MQSVEKLKTISHRVRLLVFAVLALAVAIAVYGYIKHGVWWVSFGDEQFNQLWQQQPQLHTALSLLMAPIVLSMMAGFYWLQRLLLELSRGLFFSTKSMSCMKWLAWLALFSTLYSMLWPVFATLFISNSQAIHINVRPLTLIAVLCLPVVVHLLSAARELDQDSKEII